MNNISSQKEQFIIYSIPFYNLISTETAIHIICVVVIAVVIVPPFVWPFVAYAIWLYRMMRRDARKMCEDLIFKLLCDALQARIYSHDYCSGLRMGLTRISHMIT